MTASVLVITALLTGLQFIVPGLLDVLQRTPAAISSREWWRLVTPMFINRGSWQEIAFNLSSLLIVGTVVERLWGRCRWLIFYLIGGLTGEIAGLAWQPNGAGTSVAVCGLLGALSVWLLFRIRSWQARFGGAILILGSMVLTGLRNLHGPPLLAGVCIAGTMLWREEPCRKPESIG